MLHDWERMLSVNGVTSSIDFQELEEAEWEMFDPLWTTFYCVAHTVLSFSRTFTWLVAQLHWFGLTSVSCFTAPKMRIGPDFQAEMPQTTTDCKLHLLSIVNALCTWMCSIFCTCVCMCVHSCVCLWLSGLSHCSKWSETESYVAMETNRSITWRCWYVSTLTHPSLHFCVVYLWWHIGQVSTALLLMWLHCQPSSGSPVPVLQRLLAGQGIPTYW